MFAFSIAYGVMQLVFGPLGGRFGKARLVCVGQCRALVIQSQTRNHAGSTELTRLAALSGDGNRKRGQV